MKKQMMSLMAVATLLLGGVQTTTAQNWRNAPQYHFGVRAGLSDTQAFSSDWVGDCSSKDKFGPVVGVAFDTKIAELPFYIETGGYFMNRGLKYAADVWYDDNQRHRHVSWSEDNNSLLIPVMLSYHAYINKTMSFQPFFGPYVAFGFEDDATDYGLRMGCGFNVKQFYVNTGFDVGLRKDFDTHEGNVCSLFMTVGWNFLGKR